MQIRSGVGFRHDSFLLIRPIDFDSSSISALGLEQVSVIAGHGDCEGLEGRGVGNR